VIRIFSVTLGAASALALVLSLSACKKTPEAGGGAAREAAAAAAPAKPPVEGELVLTATLKDIAGPFPANDIYNYAYVMRYEVDKVHQGAYPDKDILVGHYNPRLAREEVKDDQDPKVGGNLKSFQVGDRHYLVLSPLDGIWTGAVEDEYYKDKRPRHWALWADMAQAE
jgi:hypothetical protein